MKVIIAGSRDILDYNLLLSAIKDSGWEKEITEVVSGGARGVDSLGEMWAHLNGINIQQFPAEWDNLTHPEAVIRYRKGGKPYDANAGFRRNREMGEYGDRLIALWDGKSGGTKDMIHVARFYKLEIFIYRTVKQIR